MNNVTSLGSPSARSRARPINWVLRMRRRRSKLSVQFGLRRLEINQATGADPVDGLPLRGCTPLVSLFGLLRRPPLRPACRRPLCRGRSVRLPALLWISLRQPAGEPAKSSHQPLAKDQNAARWQSRRATVVSEKAARSTSARTCAFGRGTLFN
jgi:hypothetical protein